MKTLLTFILITFSVTVFSQVRQKKAYKIADLIVNGEITYIKDTVFSDGFIYGAIMKSYRIFTVKVDTTLKGEIPKSRFIEVWNPKIDFASIRYNVGERATLYCIKKEDKHYIDKRDQPAK